MPASSHRGGRPAFGLGPLVRCLAIAIAVGGPAAAFEIVSTNPPRLALGVQPNRSRVDVVFDAPLVLPPAAAFRVAGSMSGLHPGSVEVHGDTLRLAGIDKPFLPGELVQVDLRSDIQAVGGATLAGGRCFAFTIASVRRTPDWSHVTTWPTASIPYFIHGGDLDGDGRPDLAVPNEGTHDVSIFRNTAGNGEFPAHSEYGVGQRPSSIFGEDFDNDGDQDLATADIVSGTVTVLRNTGGGGFLPVASYFTGSQTRQIHGGDFDGDGDVDLAATSRGTGEVYFLTNRGNGTFTVTAFPDVGGGPFAVRCADLDGDGHRDVAVACQTADSLVVLRNTGAGGFEILGRFRIDDGPWCLNGNDFDGDGDFDLVSVASSANRLVLLRNDGSGKFPTRATVPAGSFPLGVFAADLDGDGDVDATCSNYASASVGVYLNDGTGTLTSSATLLTSLSASYTWAHDLDGDGDLDLSTVDEESDQLFVFLNGGTASDAAEWPEAGAGPRLAVVPNPLRPGSGARFRLVVPYTDAAAAPASGLAVLDIWDVAGRRVRRLRGEATGPARVEFVWDGRDAAGRPAAAGRYLGTTTSGGRRLAVAVVLLQ